jgi:TPR repeat protein
MKGAITSSVWRIQRVLLGAILWIGICSVTMGVDVAEMTRKAEQGYAIAQYNLGVMYANGRGVPKDYVEAVKWWSKAAEQGHAAAQYNLGSMYDNGEGVPEDDAEAYAWWNVAEAGGHKSAQKNRDIIKRNLTPTQLERGQALAKEIFERIQKRNE